MSNSSKDHLIPYHTTVDKSNLKLLVPKGLNNSTVLFSVLVEDSGREGTLNLFSLDTLTSSLSVAKFACNSLREEGKTARVFVRVTAQTVEEVF